MRPPNLLFVFADQMRGMDMGCAGNPDVKTPTMDRLAGQGMCLGNAIATSPVCGPNRAILLTGTYPTTNRVIGNDLPLPAGLPGLGTLLKAAGYRTGYVGKWHLDGVPRSKWTPPGPRRQGFDDFWAAYNCTHAYFAPKYYRDGPDVIEAPGRYEPEVQTDLALEFLDRHTPGADPFCLVVSWGPPHDPYDQVPDAYRALYDPQALTLRPNVVPETDNPLAARWECRRTTADYYAAITALDHQLARLLEGLDARGLAEDTLVVFTSDHGDMLWSHGWMKKQSPYEESIRVPLLVRWPGRVPAGATSDALLGTVDVLPTLLGMMGLPCPAGIEGRDLSARCWAAAGTPPAPCSSATTSSATRRRGRTCPRGAACGRRATPMWRRPAASRGCFSTTGDPYQQDNLIESPAHRAVRDALRDLLTGWLARTNDPFGPELIDHLGLAEPWRERQASCTGPPQHNESRSDVWNREACRLPCTGKKCWAAGWARRSAGRWWAPSKASPALVAHLLRPGPGPHAPQRRPGPAGGLARNDPQARPARRPAHLADAWLEHIHLWPDEYGVACRNLAQGLYPPVSGGFDNGFTAGMGAAIRSEIWACLAPGDRAGRRARPRGRLRRSRRRGLPCRAVLRGPSKRRLHPGGARGAA